MLFGQGLFLGALLLKDGFQLQLVGQKLRSKGEWIMKKRWVVHPVEVQFMWHSIINYKAVQAAEADLQQYFQDLKCKQMQKDNARVSSEVSFNM